MKSLTINRDNVTHNYTQRFLSLYGSSQNTVCILRVITYIFNNVHKHINIMLPLIQYQKPMIADKDLTICKISLLNSVTNLN